MKLVYGVNDRPKPMQLLAFSFQQLLAIMAATIAVPRIVGNGMSAAAALFGAGVGTLVYLLFTKFKSPVFLGSSFAFIGSMSAAFAGASSVAVGYLGLIIGALFAGLVYVVIAVVVKFVGVGWVNKLMPASVIGPTVAIIGLSLSANAVSDLLKGAVTKDAVSYAVNAVSDLPKDAKIVSDVALNGEKFAIIQNVAQVPVASVYLCILCGLVTLAVTMLCSVYGKKMLKMIPFIIGIVSGYAVAAILTAIGIAAEIPAMQIIDFSKFSSMQWYPDFTFIQAFRGFSEIENVGAYITTVAVAYVPVAFVVFAEHIADHKNLSSIIEHDLLDDPGLHRTLLGDGVGSFAGAIFGGCPNTTYGESVGCVAISGNASVVTILGTAIMAIVISFIAPFSTFLATIPPCVMGGVCISLYGFIAVSGLKMVQKVDLEDNRNLFTVSVILISGIGGLALTIGAVTITPVACALILGILTNTLLGKKRNKA